MRYNARIRQAVLRKVLPPQSKPVSEVSLEFGITEQTINGWIKLVEEGKLSGTEETGPRNKSASEKLDLLLENARIQDEHRGEWLRSKGLHSEHLPLWEQELRDTMDDKDTKEKDELKALRRTNKQLEKENARQQKALAEMAALLTLKKKAERLWGASEED